MANSGYKNITRIDIPKKNTHGWYVRIFHRKTMYAKFFSDARHDSAEDALQEAVQYRNELEEALGKPRTERRVITESPRSQTGVIGVQRRVIRAAGRQKTDRDVYEVTWSPEPNVIRRTSVSITLHGEEEAFRRACEIRREKEREMYGQELEEADSGQ